MEKFSVQLRQRSESIVEYKKMPYNRTVKDRWVEASFCIDVVLIIVYIIKNQGIIWEKLK